MSEHVAELNVLRNGARLADWTMCRKARQNLLRELGCLGCAKLVIYYVELYSRKFHNYHPEESWVSVRIGKLKDVVALGGAVEDWIPLPESENQYTSPGSMEFVRAIERLWRIPTSMNKLERCVELTEAALSELFTANLVEQWGRVQPELWQQVRQRQENYILDENFRNDIGVRKLSVELWLLLADEIEKRLQAKHPPGK
jgi:hypothetical protein